MDDGDGDVNDDEMGDLEKNSGNGGYIKGKEEKSKHIKVKKRQRTRELGQFAFFFKETRQMKNIQTNALLVSWQPP